MKLYPYQVEGVAKLKRFGGRALLADAPGLGKTLQTLRYLADESDALPAIIVCPASVKWHWRSQARMVGLTSSVLEGFDKKPRNAHPDLWIVNYDILPDHRIKGRRGKREGRLGFLLSVGAKTVGLDEGHYVANSSSKRSKAVRKLCIGKEKVIVITGTPMRNRPIDLFNSLNLLWPAEFPSRFSFGSKFCRPRWTPWGMKYDGASNLKVLYRRLRRLGYIRRRKRDVLKDLPKLSQGSVSVPLSDPAEYIEAELDFLKWLRKEHPQKAKRAARAMFLAKSGYLLRLAATLKMSAVEEWIDDFLRDSGDGKLAVFAIHKAIIGRLRERYGRACVWIDGSVAPEKRPDRVAEFQRRKSCRLFLGNVQAAGVGMDGLQRCCSTGLLIEFPWSPEEVKQVVGRLDRIGQKEPVQFTSLVGKGTIEESVLEVLRRKQKHIETALDGGRPGEGGFYEAMVQILKEKK